MKLNRIITVGFFALVLAGLGSMQWIKTDAWKKYGTSKETSQQDKSDQETGQGLLKNMQTHYRSVMQLRRDLRSYYTKDFVLKNRVFDVYSDIQSKVFHVNPIPEKTISGMDGWHYLGDSYSNAVRESIGISPFTEEELDLITKRLLNNRDWLEERGIAYYVVMPPNKHTVYQEFLPIEQSDGLNRLSQLDASLQATDLNWLNLAPYLPSDHDPYLYYKTDSHWNHYGAYLGYEAIVNLIAQDFPEVVPLGLDDFNITTGPFTDGDLTTMLKMESTETTVFFEPKKSNFIKIPDLLPIPDYYTSNPNIYEQRFVCEDKPLKVLVLNDSFNTLLQEYLRETFGESVMLRYSKFDREVIEREAPDIVIRQLVERNIERLLKN